MRKILMVISLLFISGVIILFIMGRSVREVTTEVQISAPIEKVWKVLTEFNKWKDWNPTIILAEGESSVGSNLNITINGNGKGDSNYQPIVVESSAPNTFRWRATMITDYFFKNDRVFILESKNGGTFLTQREEFSGLMVPPMWKMFQGFVSPSLEKMNQALKKKIEVESLAQEPVK